MGFSGGGGGVLTNHTHDTAVTNDGGALAANATMFGLTNQSMLVSDGTNIQELALGGEGENLTSIGGAVSWEAHVAGDVLADVLVMANSTTIGDYTQPASATCSSSASSGPTTVTITGVFEAGGHPMYSGSDTRRGEVFVASAALLGESITGISAWIKKSGSPTGTLYFRAYDSGGSLVATFGSLDVSTLTTSFVEESSGTVTDTRTVAVGDRFLVEYSGGDASNYVEVEVASSCLYDCPYVYATAFNGGWSTNVNNDYHFSFTYEDIPNPCSNAVDDNTATSWLSSTETNPNIYVDMSSSTTTSNLALYPNTGTTETEILIQSSDDAAAWTTQRTITWSNLTEGAWNYIRFNIVSSRYWRIYGNSGNSVDMQIDEIKVLDAVSDANVRTLHGHIGISSSDTSLNNAGV